MFSRFCINDLGFSPHPMDPCVLILFEDLKKYDSDFDMDKIRVISGSGAQVFHVAAPGDMCGVLGQHGIDSILVGRGKKWTNAISLLRKRFPFCQWLEGGGDVTGSVLSSSWRTFR